MPALSCCFSDAQSKYGSHDVSACSYLSQPPKRVTKDNLDDALQLLASTSADVRHDQSQRIAALEAEVQQLLSDQAVLAVHEHRLVQADFGKAKHSDVADFQLRLNSVSYHMVAQDFTIKKLQEENQKLRAGLAQLSSVLSPS